MPTFLCRHLDKRTEWKVDAGDASTLGFSESATVPLPDPGLLAREVRITRSADRYHLRDLAEKDRVLVNGVLTREAVLKDGDRIIVGRVAMLFRDDDHRGGRGEVDLFPGTGPEWEGEPWDILEAEASRQPRRRAAPPLEEVSWARYCAGLCLISFLFGIGFGLLYRVPRPPRQAPRKVAASPGAAPGAPTAPETLPGDTLAKLEEILRTSQPSGDTPGGGGEPGGTTARTEAGDPGRAAPPPAPPDPGAAGPPAARSPFSLETPGDAALSRRLLFRIFLDVAGRPPTRAEERDAFPASHEERFRRASAAAAKEGRGIPESPFAEWIGRAPAAAEESEIRDRATPERPPALWVTAHEEYRTRARDRSPAQRAASFAVDLLDRPLSSRAELEILEAALAEPGSEGEVARILAHSPESRISAAGEVSWELDFFRFLLREPLPEERSRISAQLERTGEPVRQKALLAALAALPGYRSY